MTVLRFNTNASLSASVEDNSNRCGFGMMSKEASTTISLEQDNKRQRDKITNKSLFSIVKIIFRN